MGVRTEATSERSSFFSCIDFILCVGVPYRLYCSKDSGAFKKGSGLFLKKGLQITGFHDIWIYVWICPAGIEQVPEYILSSVHLERKFQGPGW